MSLSLDRADLIRSGNYISGEWLSATGPLLDVTDPATGNLGTVLLPAGTTARYVQVVVTGNTGWPAGQVSELGIYRH